MESGSRQQPRPTATAVAAPQTSVPSPRNVPAVESAAPGLDTTGPDRTTVDTGPITVVPAARSGPSAGTVADVAGGAGGAGGTVATAPAVEAPADPLADTGPIAVVVAPVVHPPVMATVTHPCRCGHDRDAHEHFRRGTDCAGCGCERFRKPGLLARLRG